MINADVGEYFSPLGIISIVSTILIVLSWEIVGTLYVSTVKLRPDFIRLANWLLGLGIYIFIWFVLNLFLPISRFLVVTTLIVPLLLSLPLYLRKQKWRSLFSSIRDILPILVIFLPFLPVLFVKSSLPPYLYDEMAYQFISPAELRYNTIWSFSSGLYQIIPKSLNLMFHTIFALFNSYAPVRLIHFLVYFTAIVCVYRFLLTRVGGWLAIVFFLLSFSFTSRNIFITTTSGYVDTGVAGFVLLGIIIVYEIVISRKDYHYLALSFFGLAVGTKYPALVPFFAAYIWSTKDFVSRMSKRPVKRMTRVILVFLLFGGFWYLKNFIFTHNPIYPFLFGCRPSDCVRSGFFNGWTTPISVRNLPYIIYSIFDFNKVLVYVLFFAFWVSVLSHSSKNKRISILFFLSIVLELLVTRFLGGYLFRYAVHLYSTFILFIIFSVSSSVKDSSNIHLIKKLFSTFLILYATYYYLSTIRLTYSSAQMSIQEVAYARGKHNISVWSKDRFGELSGLIEWCNQRPADRPTYLHRTDPYLIWDNPGLIRIFLTNCLFDDIPLAQGGAKDIMPLLYMTYHDSFFYVSSKDHCLSEEEVERAKKIDDLRFRTDNEVVCSIPQIRPHIYLFEAKK